VGPPSGTVTFLFTDIEGSTRLWHERPDAMPAALERHDEIVRSAIEARGGHVFSTGGDSFGAAFARAGDAVRSAVDGQRALAAEQWTIEPPIRVRMGLCTGEAQERDRDYFGSAVNRAARVMAAGHGGQILVSQSTAAIVEGVALSDLGEHRLRDLSGVEHLFQVVAEGLAAAFPPLRTAVAVPNNLPLPVDRFVGRAEDLAAVVTALRSSRLVTLTGVGGTGKTRLALEAAAGVLDRFPDGVWLVELAPVSEVQAVPFVVGAAVGAVQQPDKSMLESLAAALATQTVLLVLDNCEHLLDQVAILVAALESRCRGVTILATSREGLGVRGEHLMVVGSLSAGEGALLFAARADDAGITLSAADPGVGRIVARLDGLPLAIELAAARTRGLSVAEIEHRLAERFRLLRGSSRGRVERHQTLWNTVAWSHQLLDKGERRVFDRLAIFAGGFSIEAATAVCAGDGVDPLDVEDAVLGLVDRSMVLVEPSPDGTRYRLLETLRQFGESQLIDDDTIDEYRLRHGRWYAQFARRAADGVGGVDGISWNRRLMVEVGNYRAVVYGPDLESARRIVASLTIFPILSQSYECIDWALAVIDPPAPEDLDWMGCALWGIYATHFVARSENRARIVALVDPDAIPPGVLSYAWLNDHASIAIAEGEPLVPYLQPMLDIATGIDDGYWRLVVSGQTSLLAVLAGDLPFAASIWERLAGDPARGTTPLGEAVLAYYQGVYLAAIGDARARECFERCRLVGAECGWSLLEQLAGSQQVPLLIDAGDLSAARLRMIEGISGHIRTGAHLTLWISLHHFVRLLIELDYHDHAVEIWAELQDRAGWNDPAQRADLEARLGPPGTPHLTDDELIARISELIVELEQIGLGSSTRRPSSQPRLRTETPNAIAGRP
jgi:predicted ATPase/class 3 adenylate cyclase